MEDLQRVLELERIKAEIRVMGPLLAAALGRLSIYDVRLAEHWMGRETALINEIVSTERHIDCLINRALGGDGECNGYVMRG